jgi:hypothetical protein
MITGDTKAIEYDGDVVRSRAEHDVTERVSYLCIAPTSTSC